MITNNEWKQQTQFYNSYIITARLKRRTQMLNTDAWIHADLLHFCCVAGGIYGDLIP